MCGRFLFITSCTTPFQISRDILFLPFAYVIRAWMARDQKHNQDTLIVIELSKWACLATQKEEKYKFISKQVLLIDKHIKRGIP